MKRKTVSKPITLTYLHYTGVERGERKKETDMKENSMRKSHISLSLSLETRERDPRHIREMEEDAPPSGFCAGEAGHHGWIDPSRLLVSTGERKKDISIDLRAPTPPTLFDVDDASNSFFFLVYKRKKKFK